MADDDLLGLGPPGALKRPRFEAGDSLASGDLIAEQAWRGQRLRRHNRHLHGWGIVCGLRVAAALDASRPWGVIVCPGYALGPYGDEIVVPCAVAIDIRDWIWTRPDPPAPAAYVVIRYAETTGAARQAGSRACGCEGGTHAASVSDHWVIEIVWQPPDRGARAAFDFCRDVPPCAPCPPTPYVLLAAVRLPPDEGTAILPPDVDLSVRVLL